jgi:uridine kinase
MSANHIFSILKDKIDTRHCTTPKKIAIEGIDASGKTTFADRFADYLRNESNRQVIRASIDGFHNPRENRLQQGEYSPEGYYNDSFNYLALKQFLLDPLLPSGNRQICTRIFDYKCNGKILENHFLAEDDAILIFDGIFLMRSELVNYWDFKIFLNTSFKTALERALERDKEYFGDENILREKYEKRYFPGQELYLSDAHPEQIADIVIDNEDFNSPTIIKSY